jgi:hypothetical protein
MGAHSIDGDEGNVSARPLGLPRYEYKQLWWVERIKDMTMETLNALGDQGWHVVATHGDWLILERPKLWMHNQFLSCCHGRPCCHSCLSSCSAPRETE